MNKLTRIILTCLCLSVAAMGPSTAFAAKKKKAKSSKSSKNPSVVFDGAWTEKASDRTKRLKRECKGQVNAGACAGFTRG